MMRQLACLLFLILSMIAAQAQSMPKEKRVKKVVDGVEYEVRFREEPIGSDIVIKKQIINVAQTNNLEGIIKKEGIKDGYYTRLSKNLVLDSCVILGKRDVDNIFSLSMFNTDRSIVLFHSKFSNQLVLNSINSRDKSLDKIDRGLYIIYCSFDKVVDVSYLKNLDLQIENNTFSESLFIQSVECNRVSLFGNKHTPKSDISLYNCAVKETFVLNDNMNIESFHFGDCKFSGLIDIGNYAISSVRFKDNRNKHIRFKNCFIDAKTVIGFGDSTHVNFEDCVFGENFSLNKLSCNLHIKNCKFESNVRLAFNRGVNTPYAITLSDVDINKIDLNYEWFVNLQFDEFADYYQKEQIYQDLLEKFQREHRNQPYRRLLFEYNEMKFKECPDLVELWFTKISGYWWTYGLNRYKGITNSIALFCFFWGINFAFAKYMSTTYEIPHLRFYKWQRWHSKWTMTLGVFRHLIVSLFYTAFVMFSIRVDSSKLHFDNLLFTWVYFGQYISGIGILLFIVNYLLTR